MAKVISISELDGADLADKLSEAKQEIFNLRFQIATGQLDNSSRLKLVKKDIARFKTETRAREIAEAEAEAEAEDEVEILDGGEET